MAGTGTAHLRDAEASLLRVEDLVVEYRSGRGHVVQAVAGISLDVLPGETLGLVGESGCGKSSTGRAIVQLPPPTSGAVRFEGTDLASLRGEELRRKRARLSMIFQDPVASLNPRRTVGEIVAEPNVVWRRGSRSERVAKARATLEAVGIPGDSMKRKPHQFSGGQCQRINIARALTSEPALIICDEPVSALDVSVQASILNLLQDLKEQRGLTMLFISHDLGVVRNVSDRVAVMYRGKLCEVGEPEALYRSPAHPYTRLLLDSIPGSGADRAPNYSSASTATASEEPTGCRFRARCPVATSVCATAEPEMRQVGDDQFVACHNPLQG
jgi:peptide/nickel transport system ATP-binding protein